MFELVDNIPQSPVIKVIGVGGGGGNAVNHMVKSNIEGVEFICANTDAQALKSIGARTILQLGTGVTKGLGAGANPEVGRQAALEDRERIAEVLQGTRAVVNGVIEQYTGNARFSWVDGEDVARVAAQALLHPEKHAGQTYRLGYDVQSYGDIAAIMSRVLGQPFRYDAQSPDVFLYKVLPAHRLAPGDLAEVVESFFYTRDLSGGHAGEVVMYTVHVSHFCTCRAHILHKHVR